MSGDSFPGGIQETYSLLCKSEAMDPRYIVGRTKPHHGRIESPVLIVTKEQPDSDYFGGRVDRSAEDHDMR